MSMADMVNWRLVSGTGRQRTRCGKKPLYAEGLYEIGSRTFAWIVPNGSWGESNAGLIAGDGESLLVDTLWDLKYTSEMLRAMESIAAIDPIRCLVNTHADGDHIWGNQLVTNAEILMTPVCNEEARRMKPAAMIMFGRLGRALQRLGIGTLRKVGTYFHSMVRAYDFRGIAVEAATRTVEGETTLLVGGREVRLIEVGPAHSRSDLMVCVPDVKTLFCGDILFAGCTPVVWAGPVEKYIAALDLILNMDVDVLVPGHGPISDKGAATLQKEYLEYIRDETARCYRLGVPANEAAYRIARSDGFRRKAFSSWDAPERIMTSTHMIYRHLQGRTGHLKTAEKLNLLREQAMLAFELHRATPASQAALEGAL